MHAASFALKKYVKEHWSPFFTTFKGPPATAVAVRASPCRPSVHLELTQPPQEKSEIRSLIFASLADPTRKIRLACVYLPLSSRLSAS